MTDSNGHGGKRPGAGRPKGTTKDFGIPTRMMRVSTAISKERVDHIPQLIDLINHWEDEYHAARARGESCRTYEKMMQMIEEIRILGY